MGKVRRIDYSPSEYISGVGGKLNATEQGVYWMICSLIMDEGRAIENDPRRISGLCRIRPAEARKLIEKLVSVGKLQVEGDGKLSQKRARSEIENASNRISIASENGSKGGRPRKIVEQNQQNDKADGFSGEKLSSTINHQSIVKEPSVPKKRASRLPPEWAPSEDDKAWLRSKWQGVTASIYSGELEKFRNYWISKSGKDATKLDWSRTWQNWMMTALERAGSRPQPKQHATDILANLIGEMENAERLASEGTTPPDQQHSIAGPRKRDD